MGRLLDFNDTQSSATSPTDVSTGTITGTRAAPIAVPVGGITPVGDPIETIFVEGDGGPINVTNDPRIAPGSVTGELLTLIGTSDVNTLTFQNGNGLQLNGTMTLADNSVLNLTWDGTQWLETSRQD